MYRPSIDIGVPERGDPRSPGGLGRSPRERSSRSGYSRRPRLAGVTALQFQPGKVSSRQFSQRVRRASINSLEGFYPRNARCNSKAQIKQVAAVDRALWFQNPVLTADGPARLLRGMRVAARNAWSREGPVLRLCAPFRSRATRLHREYRQQIGAKRRPGTCEILAGK